MKVKNKFSFTFFFLKCLIFTTFVFHAHGIEKQKINLKDSLIYIDAPDYSWRTSIQSVLVTKNNNYYLMKEIMVETMGNRPFYDVNRHLFLPLVENNKINIFKTAAVGEFTKNIFIAKDFVSRKYIKFSKVEIISKEKVIEILNQKENVKLNCSINYT